MHPDQSFLGADVARGLGWRSIRQHGANTTHLAEWTTVKRLLTATLTAALLAMTPTATAGTPTAELGSYTNPHPVALAPLEAISLPMGEGCKIGRYFCGKIHNSRYSTTGLTVGKNYPSHKPQRWLKVNRNTLRSFGWHDTDMIYSSPSCRVYINGTIQARGWVKTRNSFQTIVVYKYC